MIFRIFRDDLKSAVKYFFTFVVIIAICVIPSLYAWINIYANQDPYVNTGNLPVAVASNDQGITLDNGDYVNKASDVTASLFDAVYWAAVSLTTIGYGDFYPVTDLGKFITIVSSVMGVAVVALPSGVIIAGYMNEVRGMEEEMKEKYKEIQDKIRKAEDDKKQDRPL